MIEIERKFLVTSEVFKAEAHSEQRIIQGFLSIDPERTVRVRTKGTQGFLTIKGKSNEAGTTRFEWEKEISVAEAEALLQLCHEGAIEKIRYEISVGGHVFEVDRFLGNNAGLILAEVELASENESFSKPKWLGMEVTGDPRYYNSTLSKKPFNTWKEL